MKQWKSDKENPDSAKERENRLAKKKEKINKKVKPSAMAAFHGIQLDKIVK